MTTPLTAYTVVTPLHEQGWRRVMDLVTVAERTRELPFGEYPNPCYDCRATWVELTSHSRVMTHRDNCAWLVARDVLVAREEGTQWLDRRYLDDRPREYDPTTRRVH